MFCALKASESRAVEKEESFHSSFQVSSHALLPHDLFIRSGHPHRKADKRIKRDLQEGKISPFFLSEVILVSFLWMTYSITSGLPLLVRGARPDWLVVDVLFKIAIRFVVEA